MTIRLSDHVLGDFEQGICDVYLSRGGYHVMFVYCSPTHIAAYGDCTVSCKALKLQDRQAGLPNLPLSIGLHTYSTPDSIQYSKAV